MRRMNALWWILTLYAIAFPLLVLLLGLRDGVGHALALFLILSILCACFSLIWMMLTIYHIVISREEVTARTWVRLSLVVLSIFLWIVMFFSPL